MLLFAATANSKLCRLGFSLRNVASHMSPKLNWSVGGLTDLDGINFKKKKSILKTKIYPLSLWMQTWLQAECFFMHEYYYLSQWPAIGSLCSNQVDTFQTGQPCILENSLTFGSISSVCDMKEAITSTFFMVSWVFISQ